jgi:hypothetical protein
MESDHIQVIDGVAMPIPQLDRFVFADGTWRWIPADRADVPLTWLCPVPTDDAYSYRRLEWRSCCAVAACAWRDEALTCAARAVNEVTDDRAEIWLERERQAATAEHIWEAALAKAEKGTRCDAL